MTTIIDAIFARGVLRPIGELGLRENERVRIIVQTRDRPTAEQRRAALERLRQRVYKMNFRHGGPYATRDKLHERG